jgi:hypothetical protein
MLELTLLFDLRIFLELVAQSRFSMKPFAWSHDHMSRFLHASFASIMRATIINIDEVQVFAMLQQQK